VSILKKWNNAYKDANIISSKPASVLIDNIHLLSKNGNDNNLDALDLACGRGGNAIFLAEKGYKVDAIDISPVVLRQLEAFANKQDLTINCIEKNIETTDLSRKKYDVIIVSYFLNRRLFPQIIKSLKPNGLLFYQTWSKLSCEEKGPSNPNFRLDAGELLKLCASLRIIYYQENGSLGDIHQGLRNEALLIAQNIIDTVTVKF